VPDRQQLRELDLVLGEHQHGVGVVDDVLAVLGEVRLVDADVTEPIDISAMSARIHS